MQVGGIFSFAKNNKKPGFTRNPDLTAEDVGKAPLRLLAHTLGFQGSSVIY